MSDDYYFDSYSHFGIHEEMIKDKVRTTSYQQAIHRNRHMFQDKVVLDVGCGTGILSMFAAKAGARLVIGVDQSEIIDQARQIVHKNGFGSRVVLIKGTMETVQLPVDEVDIIISEWMGYFLLYESMLATVLFARDRYLGAGGQMFPNRARMYLVGIEDAEYKEEKIHFWDNVYGFDMSCIKELALKEPLVDTVDAKQVVTCPCTIKELDLRTVDIPSLAFQAPFELKVLEKTYVHAFVGYFDILFSADSPVYFSTSPHSEYTHWKQTVFYLRDVLKVEKGDQICGTITCGPNKNRPRDLDIQIVYEFHGQNHSKDCLQFHMR